MRLANKVSLITDDGGQAIFIGLEGWIETDLTASMSANPLMKRKEEVQGFLRRFL